MNISYFYIFLTAFFLSLILTFVVKHLAFRLQVLDTPDNKRKQHKKSTPLWGGVGIFIAYFFSLYLARDFLLSGNLTANHWLGVFLGANIILIGGILDDVFNLKAKYQFIFPLFATLAVLLGGVSIEKITNPLGGGYIFLNKPIFTIFHIGGFAYTVSLFSDLIIIFWLLGMMYTTKLLDGLDGLVSGMVGIGGLIVFLFTMSEKYYQPDIGAAAIILLAVCLGFLIFNWHPAKIFLGESGSLLLGYILGVLAIISGGKIAIALLIMGLPILDVAWTIIRRLRQGHNPFKFSDREHLHFRLLDLNIGYHKTVLLYLSFSFVFGVSALFLQTMGKIVAIFLLVLIMIFLVIYLNHLHKKPCSH